MYKGNNRKTKKGILYKTSFVKIKVNKEVEEVQTHIQQKVP